MNQNWPVCAASGWERPLFKVLFILNGFGYLALLATLYFLGSSASFRSVGQIAV